jgi:hypothetical protein
MASDDLDHTMTQKPPQQGRCPLCGRRSLGRPSRRDPSFNNWEVRDLEQLVESMDIGEVAGLLGISRWELEKRCQSLGIHIRGSNEVEE